MKKKAETLDQNSFEYGNEKVKVQPHFKPFCQVELEVETDPSLVKQAYQQAIKTIKKHITVDGFRKGKAPDSLIEKKAPQQIEPEWKKTIAHLAFQESLPLTKLSILNNEMNINYSIKSHSLEDGAKLSLFFEIEPVVPSVNPGEIQLKKVEKPVVNEEKIQETIRQTLLFFAKWQKIEDRSIQEGDFVILDVDLIEKDPPERVFNGIRFEVLDRSMAKWMKNLILDKHVGDELEGVSTPDQTASEQDKKNFEPKKVRVYIRQIESASIPELDENLLKQLGVSSESELHKNIERILQDQAQKHVEDALRDEVNEVLLKQYPFDIPNSVVNKETRFRMEQLLKDPEYLPYWNKLTPEAKQRVVTTVEEQSRKAVRIFYLCRKILADAHLTISPSDLGKQNISPLEVLLNHRYKDPHSEQNSLQSPETFARLLLEKAQNYIIKNASFSEA